MEKIRLDKWMWLTRIYKTRSQATEACNKNKIDVNRLVSKASKLLNKDDILLVRKNYIEYQYKVIDSPKFRVSAKNISDYFEAHLTHVQLFFSIFQHMSTPLYRKSPWCGLPFPCRGSFRHQKRLQSGVAHRATGSHQEPVA